MKNQQLQAKNQGVTTESIYKGILARDLQELKLAFPKQGYNHKLSDREIMYREGQQSVIDYIESRMIR